MQMRVRSSQYPRGQRAKSLRENGEEVRESLRVECVKEKRRVETVWVTMRGTEVRGGMNEGARGIRGFVRKTLRRASPSKRVVKGS